MSTFEQRRHAVAAIGTYWRRGWSIDATDSYTRALARHDADVITEALEELSREWRSMEAPQVQAIHDRCNDIERRRRQSSGMSSGPGCHKCLAEHGPGHRRQWVNTPFEGETTMGMTTCPEHRVSWPATFPAERDPGEIPGEVVAQLARQGTLGTIFQQVVQAKDQAARDTGDTTPVTITPDDVTRALTGHKDAA